ncbi:hypothetical protein ACFL05_00585 [Patescibacteria group bacterium]
MKDETDREYDKLLVVKSILSLKGIKELIQPFSLQKEVWVYENNDGDVSIKFCHAIERLKKEHDFNQFSVVFLEALKRKGKITVVAKTTQGEIFTEKVGLTGLYWLKYPIKTKE